MTLTESLEAEVVRLAGLTSRYILAYRLPRTPEHEAALGHDLRRLRDACEALIGPSEELALIRATVARLTSVAYQVQILYRIASVPPSCVWTYTFQGRSFTGRAPMPVSIKDSDVGWGVRVTDLTDAAGEPVDAAGVAVAFGVDDPSIINLVDNGDGSASFASALAAAGASGIGLPATTGIHATVTNPDGSTFTIDDTISVVAGVAAGGAFTFTPPV